MLRRRILALLGAVPILLGLLVPAAAMPCAGGDRSAMSCDVCLVGILPGTPACANMSKTAPAPDLAATRAPLAEARAWFGDLVIRPYGFHPSPDFPPPR